MQTGRIIRGIGGLYYILPDNSSNEIECKARGHFRSENLVPMVGDIVDFDIQPSGYAVIENILPRKNALIRPPVANIDLLIIVLSAGKPKPDFLLCDKLIIEAHRNRIEPLLVLNKLDAGQEETVQAFRQDYAACFDCICVSALTGEGLDILGKKLSGHVSCFAGQSAVGKSSLINALLPGLALETGGLSRKTDRGRHTTRKAELWPAFGGAVLDTPGFSLLETSVPEQRELDECYPEFRSVKNRCYYTGCMHISEPDCAVKGMVLEGGMSGARYERYKTLAAEFAYRRQHQY